MSPSPQTQLATGNWQEAASFEPYTSIGNAGVSGLATTSQRRRKAVDEDDDDDAIAPLSLPVLYQVPQVPRYREDALCWGDRKSMEEIGAAQSSVNARSINSRSTHSRTAHAPLYGHVAQQTLRLGLQERQREGDNGAPHASLHVHVHGHCPRGINFPTYTRCWFSVNFNVWMMVWSGLVCSLSARGFIGPADGKTGNAFGSAGHVHVCRFLWQTAMATAI
ncbi:hypothetical protein ACLKA6_005871 [Drosophila palustris]